MDRLHICSDRCVCPDCGSDLHYHPGSGWHVCSNEKCRWDEERWVDSALGALYGRPGENAEVATTHSRSCKCHGSWDSITPVCLIFFGWQCLDELGTVHRADEPHHDLDIPLFAAEGQYLIGPDLQVRSAPRHQEGARAVAFASLKNEWLLQWHEGLVRAAVSRDLNPGRNSNRVLPNEQDGER